MSREHDMLHLLRAVLGMGTGERWILREEQIPVHCTVHRYDDGWYVLVDFAIDRVGYDHALLGWIFRQEQDMADFLKGELGQRINNFALIGERVVL